MNLEQSLTNSGQLMEPDRDFELGVFKRIPSLSERNLLARQQGGIVDGSSDLRVAMSETTVLLIPAGTSLLPVLAEDSLVVGGHFRVREHSGHQLGELGVREDRSVGWEGL